MPGFARSRLTRFVLLSNWSWNLLSTDGDLFEGFLPLEKRRAELSMALSWRCDCGLRLLWPCDLLGLRLRSKEDWTRVKGEW